MSWVEVLKIGPTTLARIRTEAQEELPEMEVTGPAHNIKRKPKVTQIIPSSSSKPQVDEGVPESDSDVGLVETQASVRQKLSVPFKGLDKQPIARLVEMFTDAGIDIGGQREAAREATKYAKKVFKV